MFFTMNLHFVISKKKSTCRKLSLPLKSSISLVFLPLKMQRKLKHRPKHTFFLLCLNRGDPQTFESGSYKKIFSPVCMLLAQLALINVFILCDICMTLLFTKSLPLLWDSLATMLLLSLKPVFWKKFGFYALSPQY